MSLKLSLLALGLVVLVQLLDRTNATSNPKTVCYYESWVHGRNGDGKQDPSELDYHLCTHLVYAYFGIEHNEVKILDPWLMIDQHDLEHFTKAKGNSKALIAVGGSSQSVGYSAAAASDSSRTQFVKSVIALLAKYNFDGITIDWSNMAQADSANLVHLLDKFDELFVGTPYTLAITLPVTVSTLGYYDIPSISKYVDFMNVIAFDYAGPWAKKVGNASPLSKQLETLEQYHKRGAPRSKLIMSVPLYARTWTLADVHKQDIDADASGPGAQGPYSQVGGFLSYNELCVMMRSSPASFSIIRDPVEHAVHAVYLKGSTAEWISFEDTKTLAAKAKNITEMGYGGMSVYSLANEDIHGTCGKKFPLLHAIHDNYFLGAVTEGPIVTIPTEKPTTPKPIEGVFKCTQEGDFRDRTYCFVYHHCEKGTFEGMYEQSEKRCERHQAFDEHAKKCVDAKLVPGC